MPLKVNCVKARQLRDTDFFGKMDPYVVLSMGVYEYRTSTGLDMGKNVKWHEEFTFPEPQGNDMLVLRIFDEGTDKLIGTTDVSAYDLASDRPQEHWLTFRGEQGQSSGEILITTFVETSHKRYDTRGAPGRKKAFLVGCNYPGTEAKLEGCVNDVLAMADLYRKMGFRDIEIQIDTDSSYQKPTGKNMIAGLERLFAGASNGDVLAFHYSGHGAQVPAVPGDRDEKDGLDEVLVPTDMDLLRDDDLRELVETLPAGVNFTFVADCCHSGSILDHKNVVIRDGIGGRLSGADAAASRNRDFNSRSLPANVICSVLGKMTGTNVTLQNLHSFISSKGRRGKNKKKGKQGVGASKPVDGEKGILITGCKDHQTSADAYSQERGQKMGAMSNALLAVMERNNNHVSYQDLVVQIRQFLAGKYEQKPCLECEPSHANRLFLDAINSPPPAASSRPVGRDTIGAGHGSNDRVAQAKVQGFKAMRQGRDMMRGFMR